MRWIRFFCLIVCMGMLFTSCQAPADDTDSASSYDPFAESDEPTVEKTVGYTVDSWDESVDFAEDKAALHVTLTASGNDCDYRILLFVDGACTAFRLDGGEDAYMHTIEMEDEEQRSLTLDFVPTTGKAGDALSAFVILTAWLDRVPTFKEGDAAFGFADHPNQLIFTVNMKESSKAAEYRFKDCTETSPLTDAERTLLRLEENAYSQAEFDYYLEQQALPAADRDPSARLRQTEMFGYSDTMWVSHINQDKNEPLNYYISAVGTHHFQYRITVFVNNQPVQSVDGYDGVTMEVDACPSGAPVLLRAAFVAGIGFDAVPRVRRLCGHYAAVPVMVPTLRIPAFETDTLMLLFVDGDTVSEFMPAFLVLVFLQTGDGILTDINSAVLAEIAHQKQAPVSEAAGQIGKGGIERRVALYQQTEGLLRDLGAVVTVPNLKGLARANGFVERYGHRRTPLDPRCSGKHLAGFLHRDGSAVGQNGHPAVRHPNIGGRGKGGQRQHTEQQNGRQHNAQRPLQDVGLPFFFH